MNAIADGWMQTLNGGRFYPGAPRSQDFNIYDIAGALSKLCRFGGHCRKFYSVAEHSVLIAEQAKHEHKLTALMHDASEAYLVDVPRPVKPLLREYHAIENRLMAAIAVHFGFEFPFPADVKRLDNAILADERAQNMTAMAVDGAEWGLTEPPLGVRLRFWTPEEAQAGFMDAFDRYRVQQ